MDPARFCWGPAFAGVLRAVELIGIISFGYALLETESFLWFCTLHASWLGLLLGFCVLFGWDHFGGFVLCVAWVSFVVLYVSCFFLFRVYAYFVAERFVVWHASWLRCFLRFCVLRELDCNAVSCASRLGFFCAVLCLSWLNLFWGFVRFVAGVNLRFCALRGLYFVRCFVHL